jgi:acyl-coenzyme A thioesterase PaaI-like protein
MGFSEKWRSMIRRNIWLYPPFLFSGIGVKCLCKTPLSYRTTLRKRWWNQNAVGTHFGGSLFAMTDPFHMIILMEALGPDYVVWDQKSTIEYLKPGRKSVSATFSIPEERIQQIREQADSGTLHPEFVVELKDTDGLLIARITKTLYVRQNRRALQEKAPAINR